MQTTKYIYGCLSSRSNLDPPIPSPEIECVNPTEPTGEGTHSHAGEGVGVPIRTTTVLCLLYDADYPKLQYRELPDRDAANSHILRILTKSNR